MAQAPLIPLPDQTLSPSIQTPISSRPFCFLGSAEVLGSLVFGHSGQGFPGLCGDQGFGPQQQAGLVTLNFLYLQVSLRPAEPTAPGGHIREAEGGHLPAEPQGQAGPFFSLAVVGPGKSSRPQCGLWGLLPAPPWAKPCFWGCSGGY